MSWIAAGFGRGGDVGFELVSICACVGRVLTFVQRGDAGVNLFHQLALLSGAWEIAMSTVEAYRTLSRLQQHLHFSQPEAAI